VADFSQPFTLVADAAQPAPRSTHVAVAVADRDRIAAAWAACHLDPL